MRASVILILLVLSILLAVHSARADEDPRHVRHELMEDVRDAAKPVGKMLRGQRDYDAAVVMQSLEVFESAAQRFGDLFPAGTETGMDTEAAPAIWEDREGFDEALAQWTEAIDGAIEAEPAALDDARGVLNPVFKSCKNCHDGYRIEDD